MNKQQAKELTAEIREKIRIRIRTIKAEFGWTIKDITAITGDKVATVKAKLSGSNNFTLNDIILISMKSGKSFDYICGRSDS